MSDRTCPYCRTPESELSESLEEHTLKCQPFDIQL